MNLTGSVALVTGANRGLGARLVTELLSAGEDPVAQRGVAHVAGRDRIALGPDDRLARELLVPGHPLRVGVDGAFSHDVEPGLRLLFATQPDLDPWWHHPLWFSGEGTAEHILERLEPVAPG